MPAVLWTGTMQISKWKPSGTRFLLFWNFPLLSICSHFAAWLINLKATTGTRALVTITQNNPQQLWSHSRTLLQGDSDSAACLWLFWPWGDFIVRENAFSVASSLHFSISAQSPSVLLAHISLKIHGFGSLTRLGFWGKWRSCFVHFGAQNRQATHGD